MHRPIASMMLAGLLLCAGCFTAAPPITVAPAPPPKLADMPPPPPPPVRPEGVNAQNYRLTPQAVAAEIERAEQENVLSRTQRE